MEFGNTKGHAQRILIPRGFRDIVKVVNISHYLYETIETLMSNITLK